MENSLASGMALRKHGVPFGQHGLGLGKGSKRHDVAPEPSFEVWPALCATRLPSAFSRWAA